MKRKAIFLTHPELLKSEITGGVQLCSQEFHFILENIGEIELQDYFVQYTRNIGQRVRMKLGLENYSMYDVARDAPALLRHIRDHKIEIVFINMASLVRYARPIKELFGHAVKVVLLSHGNHSGDFLHLITKPIKNNSAIRNFLNKVRLGILISTEATYRVKYLDAVVALSETEKSIENWFGASKAVFIPRRLYSAFLSHNPVSGRVGFVGRLDHPPNAQGLTILLDAIEEMNTKILEFRLVGAPEDWGREIEHKYPFIKYLGELPDSALEQEVATWAILLNPVWWFSTGASTKLAKAISWGVPIASTTMGMRGYEWKHGSLIVADSPSQMARALFEIAPDMERVKYWANETRKIASSGLSTEELVQKLKVTFE